MVYVPVSTLETNFGGCNTTTRIQSHLILYSIEILYEVYSIAFRNESDAHDNCIANGIDLFAVSNGNSGERGFCTDFTNYER